MDRNDRQAIENLFGKLAAVERQGVPRDEESDHFIQDMIRRQPGAPYYMAQTIVVQEQALEVARARIEELEAQAAGGAGRASGGLLDSFFGGGRQSSRGSVPRVGRSPEPMPTAPARPSPWGGSSLGSGAQAGAPYARGAGGGGFLAGAAQTAVGVAGGVLLGNMLAGMFGGEAQAADAADVNSDPGADEAAMDEGSFDSGDAGFDAGDFGGEF